jgi:histidine phosphotransferase ChpT
MAGTQSALRLIELTSARLCHDFSGLTSALDNALYGTDSSTPLDPDLQQLIRDTARAMADRLKLRRTAWGPDDQPLSVPHIEALARGLPERIRIDLTALPKAAVFPARTARIILNILLLAAEALPSGGMIHLGGGPEDLFVRISGPAAAWPPGFALCTIDEAAAQQALNDRHSLQLAMTTLLAHAVGIRLSLMLAAGASAEPPMLRLGGP